MENRFTGTILARVGALLPGNLMIASRDVQNRKIFPPRADGLAILARHYAFDLREVTKIMHYPGRQQLTERDLTQGRMCTLASECSGLQLHRGQSLQAPISKRRERVQ
jgi:hypothetical protein